MSIAAAFTALLVSACGTLDPVEQPPEFTPPPAASAAWEALGETRPGDWYALLNEGPVALDWRLRAIDSATDSIDLQTFLWTFDTVGSVVFDHLLAAAGRGVAVRLLIDDSFLLGQDAILLEIARHPNIEYRVFNPFRRRPSRAATDEARGELP